MSRGGGARYAIAYAALFSIYGILTPYLPVMLRALGYGPAAVGLLLALFEVVGIVGPIALTAGAESRAGGSAGAGSRRMLALTALCVLAAQPLLALVPKPAATAAALVILALGAKTMVPLMDALASSYAARRGPSLRGGYGALRAPGTAGFILSAMALQLSPGISAGPPWILAACVGAAALAFLAAALALPAEARHEASTRAGPGIGGRRAAPGFVLGLVVIGLNRFGMAPITSFLSLYAKEALGLDAAGAIWAISATAEIPLMLLAGRIIARTGPMPAIALSSVAVAARLAMYPAFPSFAGIAAAQLLHSLSYGLFLPATVAFVGESFPPERRATGMALFMGFGVGLPGVLGNALGGLVVERFGYPTLFLSFIAFPLASLLAYALTAKRLPRRTPARR